MKLDIWYCKLDIRVASRIAKGLKKQDIKKLGNIRKVSNFGGHISQCLVSPKELRLCQQQLKNTQKQIPNFYFLVQFYWITPFCSKYLVQDCSYSIWLKQLHVGRDVAVAPDLAIFAPLSRHFFRLSFKYLNCRCKYSTKRQKKSKLAINKCSAQQVLFESRNNHKNLIHFQGKS